MTSRERVQKAVNFETPDRVPIDLGGMKASSIAASTCVSLKRMLGIRTPTRVMDPRFMIAEVDEELRRRFRLDVVPVDLSQIVHAVQPDSRWVPRTLFDGSEVLLPPGTGIREDGDGRLDAAGRRTDRPPPTACRGAGTTSTTRRSTGRGGSTRRGSGPQSDIPDEQLRLLQDYAPRTCTTPRSTPCWAGDSGCASSA